MPSKETGSCSDDIRSPTSTGGLEVPLVVDLDGTLISSDLLIETFFQSLGSDWKGVFHLIRSLFKGKAELKAALARKIEIDVTTLPYRSCILQRIQTAKEGGQPVYLASASNERYVREIADFLSLDGYFASNYCNNLSGLNKADKLVSQFGPKGFDYIGNDSADIASWKFARRSIGICLSSRTHANASRRGIAIEIIPSTSPKLKDLARLARVHQYAKNALVFVPLLTSHNFSLNALIHATEAFVAMSLCASSVYILNDLVDIKQDRSHPSKKHRPLAAGVLSPLSCIRIAIIFLIMSFAVATLMPIPFIMVLLAYLCLTFSYSFGLKRKMIVDVIVLALLYCIRVIAGAAAVGTVMSEWLIAFSLFTFTSLALVKRYTELAVRLDRDLPEAANRNYRTSDLPIVASLAAASGMNAVTVFALYVSSDAVRVLYRHPLALWLICPILMYWIARVLMLAHRRMMEDDPVVFALKDWRSWVCCGLLVAILGLAL